jgi:hypothetical protein
MIIYIPNIGNSPSGGPGLSTKSFFILMGLLISIAVGIIVLAFKCPGF